jgi:pSer/pThr/pTyr-binding forkhead associated (FHA) protein
MNASNTQADQSPKLALHQRTVMTVHLTDNSTRKIVPEKSPLTIGRASQQDIQITEKGVSRSHAELFTDGRDWFVVDCGSTNGTWVAGTKLIARQPAKWEPNATIFIGDATLTLDVAGEGSEAAQKIEPVQTEPLVSDETVVDDREAIILDAWVLGRGITLSITNQTSRTQQLQISAETSRRVDVGGECWETTLAGNATVWLPFEYAVSRRLFGRSKELVIQFFVSSEVDAVETITIPVGASRFG